MSDDQLNVPSGQASTVHANRIPSIGNIRNNTSRTQLSSSDVIRAHRRPSMMLQPVPQEFANEHERNESEHVQGDTDPRSGLDLKHRRVSDARGKRVHEDRGSMLDLHDRRASIARRGSVHVQGEPNNRPEPEIQDRRISNAERVGMPGGEHHEFTQHVSHDLRENVHSQPVRTRHHRRRGSEPESSRDLHPDDATAHRRRYFQGVSSARTRGSNYSYANL